MFYNLLAVKKHRRQTKNLQIYNSVDSKHYANHYYSIYHTMFRNFFLYKIETVYIFGHIIKISDYEIQYNRS